MWRPFALAVLLLAVPAAARAQTAPEQLLPAGSQFYFHWDGYAPHWDAYKKTAVGQMLQGETGTFLKALGRYVEKQARTALKNQEQVPPQLVESVFDDLNAAVATMYRHGFVLGVELRGVEPPNVQAVVVFPKGAGREKSLLSLLTTAVQANPQLPANQVNRQGRTITYVHADQVTVAWWPEGPDLVLTVGTDDIDALAARLKGGQGLADNPLYKQVKGFKEFPTWCRGYVDLPAIGKVVGKLTPEVPKLTAQLGLDSIQSLTFQMGFDGPAERSAVFLNLDGPRRGILKLSQGKAFTLADLPPMPPDLLAFSASNWDAAATYDVALDVAEAVTRLAEQDVDVRRLVRDAEKDVGLDVRQDLLAQLDGPVVQYAAPGEGILGLGATVLVRVKDEAKVAGALEKLLGHAAEQAGGRFAVRRSQYRGVTLHNLDLGEANSIYAFTYAVHKGWLAFGYYPQSVKGYVLRAEGELPAWKAGPGVEKALARFPKRFHGIAVSDPRPTVRTLLAILPPVIAGAQNFASQLAPGALPEDRFDINLIPNAYEATRHLFPNVTIFTDEGNRLQSESRTSFPF